MKSLLCLPLLVAPAGALTPGAWESFSTQTNADAWAVYNFTDEEDYFPEWIEDGDPAIFWEYTGNGAWFWADSTVGQGAFTGDFAAAKVEGVLLEAWVEDPAQIGYVGFAMHSAAGAEPRYYYSNDYLPHDFQPQTWTTLSFFFDEPWWYYDFDADEWVEVALTPAILSDISDIGVVFFPSDENTTTTLVGIDDVALSHTRVPPELSITRDADNATLSLEAVPAQEYALEQFDPATGLWTAIPGQSGLLGPATITQVMPLTGDALFRATSRSHFTQVVTPP